MWAFHTQSCHLKKWALNTSRIYVSCNSLSDFLGIWGYLRYLYTYIIIFIYIQCMYICISVCIYIYYYLDMCFHIFSSRTRCWFGRFIAASWGMWDPMIWGTKTPTNVYTSGHFYWLLLFLFGWWLLSVFSKLYCLFVVWNIFVFSISFIQRHYQIEYFPVFGDRRFCGWNLVCSWEYSICLRWVAKCWFRVCIYIYTKSLIFWAYKLWKYISKSTWF